MNINELKEKLENYKELENKMFFGRASDNRYCIMKENDKWIVFYYERGSRLRLNEFNDEESACEYYYIELNKVRIREEMNNKKNDYLLNYNFLNRVISLKISFDVFDNEEISLLQNKAYNQFMDNIQEIFIKSYDGLKDYCNKNYNIEIDETNFYKFIMPKQIYIKRESKDKEYCKFAILCNFKEDIENGLAIVWVNNEIEEIGMQDIIL